MTRYGLIFLALALTLAVLSVQLTGAAAILLAWTALGLVIVAAIYTTETAALFGKRPDGTLSPVSLTLCMPVFVLNYTLWRTMRALRSEDPNNEVAPDIHVGCWPSAADLPPGTTTIVDLAAEFPARAEVRRHPGYRSYPMIDDGFVAPERLEEIVAELVEAEGPMLIHCAAGHGRSSTLAAAVAIARGHFDSPDHAEVEMQRARPGVRFKPRQRQQLTQWWATR